MTSSHNNESTSFRSLSSSKYLKSVFFKNSKGSTFREPLKPQGNYPPEKEV